MSFCEPAGTLRSDHDLGLRMTCSGHGGAIIVWYRDSMKFKCLEADGIRYANAYYDGLKAGLIRDELDGLEARLRRTRWVSLFYDTTETAHYIRQETCGPEGFFITTACNIIRRGATVDFTIRQHYRRCKICESYEADLERGIAILDRSKELQAKQLELETTLKYHGLVLVKQYGGSVTHLIHEGLGDTQRGLCGLETRVHWRPVSGLNMGVRCPKCKKLLEKLKVLGAKEVPQPD